MKEAKDKDKPAPKPHVPHKIAKADGQGHYVVKAGDTLSGIAAANSTTSRAIREANNLKGDRVAIGQKLTIPAKGAAKPHAKTTEQGVAPEGPVPPPEPAVTTSTPSPAPLTPAPAAATAPAAAETKALPSLDAAPAAPAKAP